jgi:hypothetical protein
VPSAWCRPTSACSPTPLRGRKIAPILRARICYNDVSIYLSARLMRQALGGHERTIGLTVSARFSPMIDAA